MSTHSNSRTTWIFSGSLVFFVFAPGTVAGFIPYCLTGWRVDGPFLGVTIIPVAGASMMLAGLASLLDSFARFIIEGVGTPAPLAPPRNLVVSGQYRYVRNPMYVAVLTMVIGQGLVFGNTVLFRYAAILWLIFHTFVVLYEEPKLASQFGASYQAYRRNVRRWWPRWRAWDS